MLGGHHGLLQMSEPRDILTSLKLQDAALSQAVQDSHLLAEVLAYAVGGMGVLFAALLYYWRVLNPADAKLQFAGVHRFLWHKWYFDELYSAVLVRPSVTVAHWCRWFDANVIDGLVNNIARATTKMSRWDGIFDAAIVDGLVNLTGDIIYACGSWLRRFQTGYIRSYVLFLVLAAVAIFFALSYFLNLGTAGP
jgi:NADH-quinone oxidoreductase subunit L